MPLVICSLCLPCKEAYGLDTEAVALGTPNEETAFVLNYFGVEAPRVITSAKAEGSRASYPD